MNEDLKLEIERLKAREDALPFGDKYFKIKGQRQRLEERLEKLERENMTFTKTNLNPTLHSKRIRGEKS